MKVALFSGGRNDPASRFRYRQHISFLKKQGIFITDYMAYASQYAPKNKFKRPVWALNEILHRRNQILEATGIEEFFIIQREFLAGYLTLENKISNPKVFDFDDAIYLRQHFRGVDKILKNVDAVFCGNNILAEYASKFNKNIYIINTSVNTDRFKPGGLKDPDKIIVGWTGTATNYHSLYNIEDSLKTILSINKNINLLISSNEPPQFSSIPSERYQFIKWSPENEVEVIQKMDIGLMPLEDTPWSQGKCAYKMLLYMACGIPVVVSPVGMNADVLKLSNLGYGARSSSEWVEAILELANNEGIRKVLGNNGRKTALEYFSNRVISEKIANSIFKVYTGKYVKLD